MTKRQRVLFSQLQLAGLGVVLFVFGILFSTWPISAVGVFLFIYGMVRFFLFRKLTQEEEEDDSQGIQEIEDIPEDSTEQKLL